MRRVIGAMLVLAAIIIVTVAFAYGGNQTSSSPKTQATPSASPLPSVPLIGPDDTVPALIPQGIKSWRGVYAYGQKHPWYKKAVRDAGISWRTVRKCVTLEKRGYKLSAILVVNWSGLSKKEAKRKLSSKGYHNLERMSVVYHDGIRNRWLKPKSFPKWGRFWDNRRQIRVTLLVPIDFGDLSKGMRTDRGVLVHCGNPWDLLKRKLEPIPSPKPQPTPPPSSKNWDAVPPEPAPPAPATPNPKGTAAPPIRPAESDPVPEGTQDVGEQPTAPAVPNSGSGANGATAQPPKPPAPPAPKPEGDISPAGGIIESD